MASWSEVEQAAPELARRVRERFVSHRHAVLATLRRDGHPRVTGVETQFALGDLWMGMMGGSRKARDLMRDPRMALHSNLDMPEVTLGDARITGDGHLVEDPSVVAAWQATLEGIPPGPFHLFRVDITELSLVRAVGDHLEIETWTPRGGMRSFHRT